jgi:hypothetical protein
MSDIVPPPPLDPPGTPPPAPPVEGAGTRRGIVILVVVVALVAITAGILYGTSQGGGTEDAPAAGTYADHGVTFRYPPAWSTSKTVFTSHQGGSALWSESFGPAPGPSQVIVSGYRINVDFASVPQAAALRQITQLVQQLASGAGGHIIDPPAPATLAGLDGFRSTFQATIGSATVTVELTIVFDGKDQYNIQCQYDEASFDEIDAGCRQVRDTFRLTP